MKNDNLYTDGGNLDSQLERSNAKPEEIISDEVNFDTRKGLNRSETVVPQEIVEEVEEKGMSLERLESLGLPIFKYHTQITVHGIFDGVGSGRVGGYKNLLANQNKTLGIKYNAIDLEKKKIIAKALRLDREFNEIKGGFGFAMDSRGFSLYKRRSTTDKEEAKKLIELFKEESAKVPSNFIGKKVVNAYSLPFYGIIIELYIDFKAIKQENLWSFISALTDGRVSNENTFSELLEKENNKEKERQAIYKKEREEREANERIQLNKLNEESIFSKSKSLPTSDEFIIAATGVGYDGSTIRVYSVFRNKTGRKVYSLKTYKNWKDVPTSISNEVKESRGNKIFDDITIKLLTKYIEKGMLFDVFVKEANSKKHTPLVIENNSGDDANDSDVLLDDSRYQLTKSKHTKTGDVIYLFKLKSRLDRDDYKKIESNVKAIRGYYSSFVTAFVLKSAISANEAEMLLKGSSLENSNDNNEISGDKKINEAAINEVDKLVNKTNITEEQAIHEMKEGVKVEEEHRETLQKLHDGKISVEEAIAETASVHIEEKKDYYTEGLIPMENKDKSNDELKKQLSETELTLFNKADERIRNINLARTIELADNIAKIEGKERKDNLAFFAEALQYTVSDVENDVYARFWANDLEHMVGSSSLGFEQLKRVIEVGATENSEDLLENIKAFEMAARTFRELKNESHKALIKNFVNKYMLRNSELATNQDYIWSAINDLYKLIYFAKGNESDSSKLSEYIGELMNKYSAEIKLEDFTNKTNKITEPESVNEKNIEGSIEYTDGKYENGKDVYGANIKYKGQLAIIPLGRYESKKEVEEKANKILAEFKSGEFGEELQELIRQEATTDNDELEKQKSKYPIVLQMSEGSPEKNVGFDYLYQLEEFIKKIGVSDRPTSIYIKNKVWFKDYPADGGYSYLTIYSSYMKNDFNPTSDSLINYLDKISPSFNWEIYEYGQHYKFGHYPDPKYKAGDIVKISPDFGSAEDYSKLSIEFNYGIVKAPTIYNRDESRWKKQWEYVIVDFFNDEKLYEDVREFRLKPITETEITEELTERKIEAGEAEPLTKSEASELSISYINEINKMYSEYSEHGSKGKYWDSRFEHEIYAVFYGWFKNIICRYPLLLTDWVSMQIEKLPNYELHLYRGFIDTDEGLPNLNQFFNSLNALNVGKSKPIGLYELLPSNLLFTGNLPKQTKFELDPNDTGLYSIMKPFISSDSLRPALASINFDSKGVVATDAHKLMFLKGKHSGSGLYGFGKIAEGSDNYTKRGKNLVGKKDTKFPAYQNVIPKEYSDVITIDRPTVEKLVATIKSLKKASYYYKSTGLCYFSLYKGEAVGFDVNFIIPFFESWLKIGFDKLELTNHTIVGKTLNTNMLIVSPNISNFINDLRGSGSLLMAVQTDSEISRNQLYVNINTGVAETAGVTDDLFTDYNVAYNTYGAENEKNEIEEIEIMIDLMEETVKENSKDEEAKDYLDLLKETLIGLKAKNESKFNCGGKMKYMSGGRLPMASPYRNGGELFNPDELDKLEKVNYINNTLFYRYYPVGVNPFEISFDASNKYGYGIYFLDNPYFYKNKFTDSRLLTVRPRVQNPFIFTGDSYRTPNGEYTRVLLSFMKNDNVKDKNDFTRKMVESGYDSLIVFEPRGIYLILFSNDPDLYEVEFDVSPAAMDEKSNNDFNAKLDSSIKSVLSENKYPDLNETDALFLYNTFKQTVIAGNEEMPIWIGNEGFKGSMKKTLLKKNYIDDNWSVFNKPMSYDRNEYSLTQKGKNFINDVNAKFSNTHTYVNGIYLSKYKTDLPDGTVYGWDADMGEMVAYQGNVISIEDLPKEIQIKKLENGGIIVDENWGNDGSTASNNKDYNELYAMFPDNHTEAKYIWSKLSEKQKEGFLNDLAVTDAASEFLEQAWLEFVNAASYQDWLDNATDFTEL